jgi:hypothetical protein
MSSERQVIHAVAFAAEGSEVSRELRVGEPIPERLRVRLRPAQAAAEIAPPRDPVAGQRRACGGVSQVRLHALNETSRMRVDCSVGRIDLFRRYRASYD